MYFMLEKLDSLSKKVAIPQTTESAVPVLYVVKLPIESASVWKKSMENAN